MRECCVRRLYKWWSHNRVVGNISILPACPRFGEGVVGRCKTASSPKYGLGVVVVVALYVSVELPWCLGREGRKALLL